MAVQLGGGIRDMATIEGWLGKGVTRVILGTAAVRDPALVKEAAKTFPGPRRGRARRARRQGRGEGWAETSELAALDLAALRGRRRRGDHLHRHRARRHAQGPQHGRDHRARRAMSIPVIASGGLASIADIKALTEPRASKLEGAIAGRALYDGRLDAAEALAMIARAGRGRRHVQGPRHPLSRRQGRPRRQGRQFRRPARRRRSGRGCARLRRGRRRRDLLSRHHGEPRGPRHNVRRRATHRRSLLHAAHGRRRRAHRRGHPQAAGSPAPTRCRSTPLR